MWGRQGGRINSSSTVGRGGGKQSQTERQGRHRHSKHHLCFGVSGHLSSDMNPALQTLNVTKAEVTLVNSIISSPLHYIFQDIKIAESSAYQSLKLCKNKIKGEKRKEIRYIFPKKGVGRWEAWIWSSRPFLTRGRELISPHKQELRALGLMNRLALAKWKAKR